MQAKSKRFNVEVRQRGVIGIPAKIRKELGINDGDSVWVRREGDRIIISLAKENSLAALRGLALSAEADDEEGAQR